MTLTFGSLFAGIGGFDLGFERAGLKCKWQVEIDDYCRRVLAKNFPGRRQWDDVKTFPPPPTTDWRVDVICGGDPCQRNSSAGKSSKESLGGEFIRVVDALRPRIVVRENPTHTRRDAPWPWQRFRFHLERLGYAVLPFRLRACCFGLDHRRDRLFLLAENSDANGNRLDGRQVALQEKQSRQEVRTESAGLLHAKDWLSVHASRGLRSRNEVANCVDRIRGCGNAVVPDVAEWIGRRLVEYHAT